MRELKTKVLFSGRFSPRFLLWDYTSVHWLDQMQCSQKALFLIVEKDTHQVTVTVSLIKFLILAAGLNPKLTFE